jgi:DNA invertase Pin-like site-specific DNA recombinase
LIHPKKESLPSQAFREVGIRVKSMAEISRIVDLYDLYKSYRRVARELKISPNTVKKYLLRVKDVQEGLTNEILR